MFLLSSNNKETSTLTQSPKIFLINFNNFKIPSSNWIGGATHKAEKQFCHPKVGHNPPAEFLQRLVHRLPRDQVGDHVVQAGGLTYRQRICERRADGDSCVSRAPHPSRGAVFVMTRPVRICTMVAITCVYGWLPSASP